MTNIKNTLYHSQPIFITFGIMKLSIIPKESGKAKASALFFVKQSIQFSDVLTEAGEKQVESALKSMKDGIFTDLEFLEIDGKATFFVDAAKERGLSGLDHLRMAGYRLAKVAAQKQIPVVSLMLADAAPEQFTGEEITPASDIHALGVLLNECFNGKPPRQWKRIIAKCTSSLPDYRFHAAQEFIQAVRRRNLRRVVLRTLFTLLALGLTATLVIIPTIIRQRERERVQKEERQRKEENVRRAQESIMREIQLIMDEK